jgi:hypothetical protein
VILNAAAHQPHAFERLTRFVYVLSRPNSKVSIPLVAVFHHAPHRFFALWNQIGIAIQLGWIDEPKRDIASTNIPEADEIIGIGSVTDEKARHVPARPYRVVTLDSETAYGSETRVLHGIRRDTTLRFQEVRRGLGGLRDYLGIVHADFVEGRVGTKLHEEHVCECVALLPLVCAHALIIAELPL